MAHTKTALAALAALGDPTRRAIFERLAARPLAVGQLSEGLPVTRSAVSQHLKILKQAGLVADVSEGTRRIYRLDPRGIGAMRAWLDGFWTQALDDFAAFVDQPHEPPPQKDPA